MSRQTWTAAELSILEFYPQVGVTAIVERLGRSHDSVSSMATRVGLRVGSRARQAQTRARENKSVNASFFDELTPQVAYVLGIVWGCGRVHTAPRKVLILDLPREREQVLQTARSLMRSSHTPQRKPTGIRLEVCNSYLVESLIRNYGYPPGRSDGSASFPRSVLPLLGQFARGLLDATGTQEQGAYSWTGPSEFVSELQQHVQAHANLPGPSIKVKGHWMTISWNLPYQVIILRNWLPGRPSLEDHSGKAVQRS